MFLCFPRMYLFADNTIKASNLNVTALIPTEIEGLKKSDDVQYYAGDDLFMLINGGADLYHEYGFVEIAVQEYKTSEGEYIDLEIYRMKNSSAAYGIYSFKTASRGQKIDIGQEAIDEGYYINIWKGNYLVTIASRKNTSALSEAMKKIGEIVADKIDFSGEKPELIKFTEKLNIPAVEKTTYIMGPLALMDKYDFYLDRPLSFKEGICMELDNSVKFIFLKYSDEDEIKKDVQAITTKLGISDKADLILNNQIIRATDSNDNSLILNVNKSSIIFSVGLNEDRFIKLLDNLTTL